MPYKGHTLIPADAQPDTKNKTTIYKLTVSPCGTKINMERIAGAMAVTLGEPFTRQIRLRFKLMPNAIMYARCTLMHDGSISVHEKVSDEGW